LSSGGLSFKRRTTKNCKVLRFHPSHQSTRHGRSGPRSAGHPCLISTQRPPLIPATHTNHDPNTVLRVTVRTSADSYGCSRATAISAERKPSSVGNAGQEARGANLVPASCRVHRPEDQEGHGTGPSHSQCRSETRLRAPGRHRLMVSLRASETRSVRRWSALAQPITRRDRERRTCSLVAGR
jgi:hypothetical protein